MKTEQVGYWILAFVALVAVIGLFFTYKGPGQATHLVEQTPEGDCFIKNGVIYCNCGNGSGLTAFEPREEIPFSATTGVLCDMVCSQYGLEARCRS